MNIINGLLHSANQSKIASDALAAIQDGSNALTPSIAQGNKGAGLSLQMLRIEDLPRLKLATSANAEFGKSTAKLKVGEKLESLVGDLGQGQTILTNSLNTMVGALNILDLSQPGVRIGAINAVQGFLDSVASYEQNLTSIQSGIDTDIKDTVNSINTVLVELSSINRKIHGTESDHTLKDRRDELLQELSNKIGIQYSISPDSGRVEISTNFNEHRGFSLLTDSRCARLGYSSGMLTLDLISLSGGASEAQYNINLDGISVKGELEGWISARDGMIESHKSNIKQTMEQIVGRINDMHNLGATYNIRPTITSEKIYLSN
ncbi:MAG UNVERIFIED_CONTAM: hypothetical protein LVQ98_00355 [Rickettsiaceae bacterium]|jgi:flagellar hook-associated protein FlgK